MSSTLGLISTGDQLLINPHGETAWHAFETNEVVPLFKSFPEVIKHFVELHKDPDGSQIDSWSSTDLLRRTRR